MMLNLKEVTTLIAAEYSPHRTWLDRLSLRIHLLMCRHCRRYLQRLASVAGAVGGLYEAGPEAKLQAFSEGNPEALISLTEAK